MYIPGAEMGEYDSWKPPPQKRMSSKQMLGGASLERQSSTKRFSGVERTSSRGRMEGAGSQSRQGPSGGGRMERQDSRAKVTRQGSRARMTPSRESSQRHESSCDHHHDGGHHHHHEGGHGQSDVEMQIRMLASSGKLGRDQKSKTVRDTYQSNTKRGWQNSLRGSSTEVPARRQERPDRGGSRPVARTNSRTDTRPRPSRSESGSPSGRLFASTYSSRAKQSEIQNDEESVLKRRNSRASKSPRRSISRANSTSMDRVNRRSQSSTAGLTNSLDKRRSVFTDDDEGPAADSDPFLTYRSFKQFQDEEGNSGSQREKSKTKLSSETRKNSTTYSERKLSDSMSATKISLTEKYSNGYDSLSPVSKPYTPSAKLSSEGKPGMGGIFSSTPKYQDSNGGSSLPRQSSFSKYQDSNGGSSLARQSSSSLFSNGDSGYSASSSSFSSFSSSSVLSKRNSGVLSSDSGSWSGGKISLGSLKKPSETWDSTATSALRRGVSSTYIG